MSQVFALEQQLENAKQLVARRDLALKLSKNPDFRKLIMEQFCVTECAKYAQLSADFDMPVEARESSLAMAQAAGHLRRFMEICITMGNVNERDIVNIEAAIDQARAEEDNI